MLCISAECILISVFADELIIVETQVGVNIVKSNDKSDCCKILNTELFAGLCLQSQLYSQIVKQCLGSTCKSC